MTFLLGVLVGGLLVCLPLVVIVLTARSRADELEAITLAEMQMWAIKRDTVRKMLRAVDDARERVGHVGLHDGRLVRLGRQFDARGDVVDS